MRKICIILISIFLVVVALGLLTPMQAASECSCDFHVYNVKINGRPWHPIYPIYMCPSDTIKIEFDYIILNRQGCPGCIRQIVVGIEDQPITCVYNGIPKSCLYGDTLKDASFEFSPRDYGYTSGLNTVYAKDYAQYTCSAAKNLYPNSPYCGSAILARIYCLNWLCGGGGGGGPLALKY